MFHNTITIIKLLYYYEILMNLLLSYQNYDFYLHWLKIERKLAKN